MGKSILRPEKAVAGTSMAGKTIIVTGGNSGMGFEAARQFLVLKASHVIITVRSKSKGIEAVSRLEADPFVKEVNPNAIVEAFELELDDYQSALHFVQKVKAEVKELDVILCNAGISILNYQTSKSGHELSMQVNCYTHFLIVLELLPLLRATAQARGAPSHVSFVGSGMHLKHKESVPESQSVIDYFDDKTVYKGMARYLDAKLVVNTWVRAIAARVSPSEVIVNNVCPGMVATGFDKTLPFWLKLIMFVVRKLFAISVEEGSRKLINAAAFAKEDSHGQFLQNNAVEPNMPFLDSPVGKEFCERLWVDFITDSRKLDWTFEEPRL